MIIKNYTLLLSTLFLATQFSYMQAMTLNQAQSNYQTKTNQYSEMFDSLTMPEPQKYSSQTAYTNALATYKSQLQPSFDAFKTAATTYAQALTTAKNPFASVINAHIAYEQALFNMVTSIQSQALEDTWDQAADGYIKLLAQQTDLSYKNEARNIAEEVYGELAKLYYYYPPQLYTDKLMAKQIAIKYYGEADAKYYYPDLFK